MLVYVYDVLCMRGDFAHLGGMIGKMARVARVNAVIWLVDGWRPLSRAITHLPLCTYFVRTTHQRQEQCVIAVARSRLRVFFFHIMENLEIKYEIHRFMAVSCLLSISPCVRFDVPPYSLLPAPVRQLYVAQWRYLLLQIWTQFVSFVLVCTKQTFQYRQAFFKKRGFLDCVTCFLLSSLPVKALPWHFLCRVKVLSPAIFDY